MSAITVYPTPDVFEEMPMDSIFWIFACTKTRCYFRGRMTVTWMPL